MKVWIVFNGAYDNWFPDRCFILRTAATRYVAKCEAEATAKYPDEKYRPMDVCWEIVETEIHWLS